MKKTAVFATTLILAFAFASVSSASEDPGFNLSSSRSVNDQITDSVTQFRSFDNDGDGKISLAEAHTHGVTELNFNKVDTNGDNHVDENEYLVALGF